MIELYLTQPAYLCGSEGDEFYAAHAVDKVGNDYDVYWKITNREAFDNGDEDCCDWDEPEDIYSWHDSKHVTAKITWQIN